MALAVIIVGVLVILVVVGALVFPTGFGMSPRVHGVPAELTDAGVSVSGTSPARHGSPPVPATAGGPAPPPPPPPAPFHVSLIGLTNPHGTDRPPPPPPSPENTVRVRPSRSPLEPGTTLQPLTPGADAVSQAPLTTRPPTMSSPSSQARLPGPPVPHAPIPPPVSTEGESFVIDLAATMPKVLPGGKAETRGTHPPPERPADIDATAMHPRTDHGWLARRMVGELGDASDEQHQMLYRLVGTLPAATVQKLIAADSRTLAAEPLHYALVAALLTEGRTTDAIGVAEPYLFENSRSFGPDHPRTVSLAALLLDAHLQLDAQTIEESLARNEHLLANCRMALGRTHAATDEAARRLSRLRSIRARLSHLATLARAPAAGPADDTPGHRGDEDQPLA